MELTYRADVISCRIKRCNIWTWIDSAVTGSSVADDTQMSFTMAVHSMSFCVQSVGINHYSLRLSQRLSSEMKSDLVLIVSIISSDRSHEQSFIKPNLLAYLCFFYIKFNLLNSFCFLYLSYIMCYFISFIIILLSFFPHFISYTLRKRFDWIMIYGIVFVGTEWSSNSSV